MLAGLAASGPAAAVDARVRFEVTLRPDEGVSAAAIVVRQEDDALRAIVLDATRLDDVAGDGTITRDDDRLTWMPPATGGTLRYDVDLKHRRPGRNRPGHDSFVGSGFALFRGEDAFPVRSWRRARKSTLAGELAVSLPRQWSLVTPYLPDAAGRHVIRNPGTRLPRPIGWIIAGDLGTRRDVIEGMEITVTAPKGLRMERIAMLGLLRWTLPELAPLMKSPHGKAALPRYVSIVAAGEPMWLGALSAPNSLFVHADRPLISENGTSTVVHEMVHVLLADLDTPRDQDWIDEGLAEYLSLRALKDSGTISKERYASTIAGFRKRGAGITSLRTTASKGPVTARAVAIFHTLDEELRGATKGRFTVATLAREFRDAGREANLAALRQAAREALGKPARALTPKSAPGFD